MNRLVTTAGIVAAAAAISAGSLVTAAPASAAPVSQTCATGGQLCLYSAPNWGAVQENVSNDRVLTNKNVYSSYANNTLRCAWFWDNNDFTGYLWVAFPHEVQNLLTTFDNRVNAISFTPFTNGACGQP